MIEIGKHIVRLNDVAPGAQPWSKYGWAIHYPAGIVLYHALKSTIMVLTSEQARSFNFSRREITRLKKEGFIVNSGEDDRLADSVRGKIARPRPIKTLFMLLTDQCNLKCTYCYEHLERFSRKRSMTAETACSAIRRFAAECPRATTIFFYGGEPLLQETVVRQAIEFVRGTLHRDDLQLEIITNGTVYRDDLAEFLARHKVGIAISIDGPASVTNQFRIAKSPQLNVFSRAVALVQSCRRVGIEPSLLCTVCKENSSALEDMTSFFVDELRATNLVFNLQVRRPNSAISDDRAFWNNLGQSIARAYFRLLDHDIIESRTLRYISGLTEERYSISECDGGYGVQIAVDPDGRVGPCQGYLYDPSYFVDADHWGDLPNHPRWQEFIRHTPITMAPCHDCPFLGTCGGGCHYNRISPAVPNPNFCQYLRSLVYSVIERLAFTERRLP